MNKQTLNNIFRKFGFEIHGTGYLQSLQKKEFKEDAFQSQLKLTNGNVNIIFDVGAHVGDTVETYSSLFPQAEIFAYEPFPDSFAILKEKFSNKKHIHFFQKGIADNSSVRKMYVNESSGTNSLLEPTKMGLSSDKAVKNKNEISISTTTIQDECYSNQISSIDILKLDIQGGELAALNGAEDLLKQKKIKLIYTETYFRQQYVDQPLFYDIGNYLKSFGYFLQDLYHPIYGKGSFVWCDAIFLPS